ncbi:MAG: nucleotidyltransferase domain-containing protein [bacterium]|nr:nucleotidyltransferase domain-containing protein [bacterium]
MGKVYGWQEIEQKQVPEPTDFIAAKQLLMHVLDGYVRRGQLYGAMVYGSVAKGTPSRRSDFDLLIIPENSAILSELGLVFEELKQVTKVGVEPHCILRSAAERGDHTIDTLFMHHFLILPEDQRSIVGRDPVGILTGNGIPGVYAYRSYLDNKMRNFSKAPMERKEDKIYENVQRALEAPINIGRRTLQALHHIGQFTMVRDGKEAIVNNFRQIFDGTDLLPDFEVLLSMDREYSSVLDHALNDQVSEEEYREYISKVWREGIPRALSWTMLLGEFYRTNIEGNRVSKEGVPARGKEYF